MKKPGNPLKKISKIGIYIVGGCITISVSSGVFALASYTVLVQKNPPKWASMLDAVNFMWVPFLITGIFFVGYGVYSMHKH